MSYVETAWSHANIPAELANVRPLGDFVLVRVLPEEEMHRDLIWLPQYSGAHADRQMRPVLPSIGEVVAAGQGDRLYVWSCDTCTKTWEGPYVGEITHKNADYYADSFGDMVRLSTKSAPRSKCGSCGEENWRLDYKSRHDMHVSPGDRIMYWRVPANEVIINEQTFQFLHEEQHILGVIENGEQK